MTNEELLDNVKSLLDAHRFINVAGIAMDAGTWDRLTKAITLEDKFYTSMSGDHFLLGKKVLFTHTAGVRLLFAGPAQSLLQL